jgi:hypothetical protein
MAYDLQDCVATIPPYPHYIGERGDGCDVVSAISDPDSLWVVRLQLFFNCTLRPLNSTKGRYNRYSEDIDVDLVFFSAFEGLLLHTSGTMETNGIRKLYEPSPVPTLYVGRTEDLLGRVPLFPCFLNGNATSTIQTSMLLDRSRPSNSDAPTEQARDHAGAAMFMRSTPGCGTLAGPRLEWVAFRSPRPNGFAECPSLKRPGALGRPKMPGSGVLKRKSPAAAATEDMTCIYQTYIYHLCLLSKTCFSRQCVMSLALESICTYWFRQAVAISLLFLQ